MNVNPGDKVKMTDLRRGVVTEVVVISVDPEPTPASPNAVVEVAYGPTPRSRFRVSTGFLSPIEEETE